MKKTVFVLLLITLNSFAQSSFKKGYFITLDGTKVECFIKDENPYKIPEKFDYKINDSSQELSINSSQINALHIAPDVKYERHTVKTDLSSDNISELTTIRILNKEEVSLLLEVLVESESSLLQFSDNEVTRFFFKKNNKVIPFDYKKYKNESNGISENRNYQLQLKQNFFCANLDYNIDYKRKSFISFFVDYNVCKNKNFINLTDRKKNSKKPIFNIKGRLGTGLFSAENIVEQTNEAESYNSELVFKFGVEIEYIFALNNNKWAVFIDPSYQTNFSTQSKTIKGYKNLGFGGSGVGDIIVPIFDINETKFSNIEIPLGVRHYMYFNNNNALFINLGVNFDVPIESEITQTDSDTGDSTTYDMNSTFGFNFGLGYKVSEKITVDLNYFTPRRVKIEGKNIDDINVSNISLKIGYLIF
ncbi:porin family protein [Polaribacter aestuariivivens]|uniref:Porin family protein n=1 Tax=Polaribacter aestuariivivens TaxID=2304626 RepID=A0A5S3N0W0_9FLAO|nr:outer membrane beta-barrel protein [Polaribacter aestuariivivens]TMM28875.1 porin family protein [Polaribacter aestuariivivens]